MTVLEACHLVLQTTSIKSNGKIFILNMGKPINIFELAKSLAKIKTNLDSSYKDYSAHTRVSIHKEWIDLITKDYEKILETIEKASAESVIKF